MPQELIEKEATQPLEIMFVRHGESEANRIQQAERNGELSDELEKLHARVYERHDFEHHLTAKGVRQAKAARAVLLSEGIVPEEYFDEWYVSSYNRPVETFAYLTNGMANPLPDTRLVERDWGHYGRTPLADRATLFPDTERLLGRSNFFTRYEGGENFPDMIDGRLRSWVSTVNREQTNRRVLAVVHGELMWGARYIFEGLTPKQWEDIDKDKAVRIGNCCLLSYSRQNPNDPTDISRTISSGWRRMIDPYEPEKSPYEGKWVKLPGRTRLMGSEILAAAEAYERIIDGTEPKII